MRLFLGRFSFLLILLSLTNFCDAMEAGVTVLIGGKLGVLRIKAIEGWTESEFSKKAIEVCQSEKRELDRIEELDRDTFGEQGKAYIYYRYYCKPIFRASTDIPQPDKSTQKEVVLGDKNKETVEIQMTIEHAKSKCTSLGFKPKTEKFGNCVMELSK